MRGGTIANERLHEALHITWIGIVANIFLVIMKFIAGIWGKSSALVADAVHSLSDFGSDILVVAGLRLAEKPADRTHKYGHGKYETLSAIFLSLILIVTGFGLFWAGSQKILAALAGKVLERPSLPAVAAAFVSIVVKEILYRYTVAVGKRINSRSVIANAVHHRSDAFSSLGAMLGVGGAILLDKEWRILDPLASIAVSFFIVKVSISIITKSINELLEAALDEDEEKEILAIVENTPGVCNPHNLKTRRIGSYVAIDIHINVDPGLNIREAHQISSAVEDQLKDRFGPRLFTSVHVEPVEEGTT